MYQPQKLETIAQEISLILEKAIAMEKEYAQELRQVHPVYAKSAKNLIHYLAFRNFDVDHLQNKLRELSLPSLSNIESHVVHSLLNIKTIINHLQGKQVVEKIPGVLTIPQSKSLLTKNTKLLLGSKSKNRRTRIMVTLPGIAAKHPQFIKRLLKLGMNSSRINCAHDTPEVWEKMIEQVKNACPAKQRKCKIMMDLAGPKLRTGQMQPGPQVVHIKPKRNALGRVTKPAQVWLAPPGINPPEGLVKAILPINEEYFEQLKKGDILSFEDTRGKKREIIIDNKLDEGRIGLSYDSAFVETGAVLTLQKEQKGNTINLKVGELLPVEEAIILHPGDPLILHKNPRNGEPASYSSRGKLVRPAHISCTLPEVFKDVKVGDPIFFDDGKIEGIIKKAHAEELHIEIIHAKTNGTRLRSDKGINLPESDLKIRGLTNKDREDLRFVCKHADAVNLSFVNDQQDVQDLLDVFQSLNQQVGIILKIETQKGFKNLPSILLKAMQTYPIGVMIARGDLAIETGWKNFASIQEEILRICEAAHIPDIWATQVLESLAKKGVPTRSEITDAAMAQRAECVMLNKGAYIEKAVKMLDRILQRMQHFNKKKETLLPRLNEANQLQLSHDSYNS
ncbi:pyruvate kinase [Sunxiuqinia elliptica]|uniref:pyruvate kinase n=1 Tax=Sunxiuqinia elliptica TaxID=655355 RepID=A0A4R6H8Q1_9BACT|nr:pyruvate kinase [Sunxiuqinia elliptica]TDO04803.1 pyruvate kinase [Sunxiuqinia elliptica]TDO64350.1 pyruvate kinase [Sunxiuqinia elliptica]